MIQKMLIALAGVLLLALCALGISAFAYSREMAIDTSRGVQEAGYVRIGGIDQWVQIRGDDRTNPVLLILNGGPGFSTISSTRLFRDWEKHFTIVMWDQRGEGRTFQKTGAEGSGEMSIPRMTTDGIELSEYLRKRLKKDKIVALGFSWGSILGVGMVQQRPDLFHAYVGTGQVTDEQAMMAASYPLVLAKARSTGNQAAVEDLEAAGPPPWNPLGKALAWLIWSNAFDPGEIEWPRTVGSPAALIRRGLEQRKEAAGTLFSQQTMAGALLTASVLPYGKDFKVPVVFIQGSEDLAVVTGLVREYSDSIAAPQKEYVSLDGQGHSAMFRDPERFLSALIENVRPLALESHAVTGFWLGHHAAYGGLPT